MKYHHTSVTMATINKSTHTICCRNCGENGSLGDCWWKCKYRYHMLHKQEHIKNNIYVNIYICVYIYIYRHTHICTNTHTLHIFLGWCHIFSTVNSDAMYLLPEGLVLMVLLMFKYIHFIHMSWRVLS